MTDKNGTKEGRAPITNASKKASQQVIKPDLDKAVLSQFNILIKFKKEVMGWAGVILNPLYGTADLLDSDAFVFLNKWQKNSQMDKREIEYYEEFKKRRYIVSLQEENKVLTVFQQEKQRTFSVAPLKFAYIFTKDSSSLYRFEEFIKFLRLFLLTKKKKVTLFLIFSQQWSDIHTLKYMQSITTEVSNENNLKIIIVIDLNKCNNIKFLTSLLLQIQKEEVIFTFTPKKCVLFPRAIEEILAQYVNRVFHLQFRFMINDQNIKFIPEICNYFITNSWVQASNCRFVVVVASDCFSPNYFCSINYKLLPKVSKILTKLPQAEYLNFAGDPIIKSFEYLLKTRRSFLPNWGYCDAYTGLYIFSSESKIYPCWKAFSKKKFGINHDFSDFNFEEKNHFCNYEYTVSYDKCTSCSYKIVCGGGCYFDKLLNKQRCPPLKQLLKTLFIQNITEFCNDKVKWEK